MSLLLAQCVQKNKLVESPIERTISSQNTVLSQNSNLNRYAYEICHADRKLYLEDQLARLHSEYRMNNQSEWRQVIPLKCIQFAQRNFGGHFSRCEDENAKPQATVFRPCMTENYVQLVNNAYHDVMDCFNLDPKDYYLQIMIESGFHVNAFNKTGFDSGMAQFTGNGLRRVSTHNRIERTRRILLEHSSPSCQRIASIVGSFDITSFGIEKRCSMISLPKNPYKAMLFNYLHTMLDQIELKNKLDEELSSLSEFQNQFTEKIRRQLVLLAYNRGMTGIKRLLQGYINNRKKLNQIPTENDFDLSQNLSRAKKILFLEPEKRALLKKSKIKSLSFAEYAVINNATYVADIVQAQDYVRQYLSDECSRF